MDQNQSEQLFRFKMAFDGHYQDCGLFNGLYEVGLPENQPYLIEKLFRGLHKPNCCEPCVFWFTAEGLIEYKDALLYVIAAISPYAWSLIMTETELISCNSNIIYEDPYQVAVRKECRHDKPEDYVELTAKALYDLVNELIQAMEF